MPYEGEEPSKSMTKKPMNEDITKLHPYSLSRPKSSIGSRPRPITSRPRKNAFTKNSQLEVVCNSVAKVSGEAEQTKEKEQKYLFEKYAYMMPLKESMLVSTRSLQDLYALDKQPKGVEDQRRETENFKMLRY